MVQDIPTFELAPMRHGTIRARIVLSFSVIALACVAMAYVTGQRPMVAQSMLRHSEAIICNYVSENGGTYNVYKPDYSDSCMLPAIEYAPARPGTPIEPRFIWFFLAFWPAAFAAVTAFGSWIFTGRVW
jgi:hypothetical protein